MPLLVLQIMAGRQGDKQWYSRVDIAKCMQKAVGIDLNQAIQVRPGLLLLLLLRERRSCSGRGSS